MEFLQQFFGDHSIGFHIAGILFCLMGSLLVKRHFWLKHKAQLEGVEPTPKWSFKHWFAANREDVTTSIVVAFIFVRFIDVFLHMIDVHKVNILGVEIPVTSDTVFYYLIAGVLVQIWLHKKYKKKRIRIQGITPPPGTPPKGDDPDN